METPINADFEKLKDIIEPMLRAARIPGAAIAIVSGGETVFARGYGYRDLEAKRPMVSDTIYPIASTTKAINATLIGMLVDDGILEWDLPVQNYLPRFRLQDPLRSAQITIRDLLTMRTGLPRHDHVWIDTPMERTRLVALLLHLDLSAGFRERFQYNNMTATVAGHIAEVLTGTSWEELVKTRILDPLGMSATGFKLPGEGEASQSYHENADREIKRSTRFATEVTAPSGGAIHSTVEDMARWIAFNLRGGTVDGRALITARTLAEIHSPQMVARPDTAAPTPHATYALGWFVDTYNGSARLSHGGYLHDVNSDVMLFPGNGIGLVSFNNFGFTGLSRLINQHIFDFVMGFEPAQTVAEKLAEYERKVLETRQRNTSVRRVANTSPSHSLDQYVGIYAHPAYGEIEISQRDEGLLFRRNSLVIHLQHWHYDTWIARDPGRFFIHLPTPFDPTSPFEFETDALGDIAAISLRLEPAVSAIRFTRR